MTDVDAADWDRVAAEWSDQLDNGFDRVREEYNWPAFADMIGPIDGLYTVDLGCGDGDIARRLARSGARVVGLDPAKNMIERAAKRSIEGNPSFQVIAADDPLATIESNAVDLITCFMGVMSIEDLRPIAEGACRVLKQSGRLTLALLHPCFSHNGMAWHKTAEGQRIIELRDYMTCPPVMGQVQFQRARETDQRSFQVLRHRRTLSDVLTPFVETGLRLTQCHEPRPSAEAAQCNAHLRRWRDVAPAFLHLEFTK